MNKYDIEGARWDRLITALAEIRDALNAQTQLQQAAIGQECHANDQMQAMVDFMRQMNDRQKILWEEHEMRRAQEVKS